MQTAASLFGGYGSPPMLQFMNITMAHLGLKQTDLNTARKSAGSGGVQTASILAAGYTTTNVNNVETWNGSSWTEVAEVNTTRRGLSSLGGNKHCNFSCGWIYHNSWLTMLKVGMVRVGQK